MTEPQRLNSHNITGTNERITKLNDLWKWNALFHSFLYHRFLIIFDSIEYFCIDSNFLNKNTEKYQRGLVTTQWKKFSDFKVRNFQEEEENRKQNKKMIVINFEFESRWSPTHSIAIIKWNTITLFPQRLVCVCPFLINSKSNYKRSVSSHSQIECLSRINEKSFKEDIWWHRQSAFIRCANEISKFLVVFCQQLILPPLSSYLFSSHHHFRFQSTTTTRNSYSVCATNKRPNKSHLKNEIFQWKEQNVSLYLKRKKIWFFVRFSCLPLFNANLMVRIYLRKIKKKSIESNRVVVSRQWSDTGKKCKKKNDDKLKSKQKRTEKEEEIYWYV